MIVLRWKDKKDVFFSSIIYFFLVVLIWVENDDFGIDVDDERDIVDVVCRRVKVRGNWVFKKIYRLQIVKFYNEFMGGVDFCVQMIVVNKLKK